MSVLAVTMHVILVTSDLTASTETSMSRRTRSHVAADLICKILLVIAVIDCDISDHHRGPSMRHLIDLTITALME